jgi:hypothetical protein
MERREAGREPTAASRRPTTQATLPSADHAAEIARLQAGDGIEALPWAAHSLMDELRFL